MQDIKRELREREIQTQTQEYVLRFESLLYVPAFTQKDFHYVETGPSTNEPSPRNYKLQNKEYKTPTLTPLHKRVCTKQREKYNLVITRITTTLGDLKRSQTKHLSQTRF